MADDLDIIIGQQKAENQNDAEDVGSKIEALPAPDLNIHTVESPDENLININTSNSVINAVQSLDSNFTEQLESDIQIQNQNGVPSLNQSQSIAESSNTTLVYGEPTPEVSSGANNDSNLPMDFVSSTDSAANDNIPTLQTEAENETQTLSQTETVTLTETNTKSISNSNPDPHADSQIEANAEIMEVSHHNDGAQTENTDVETAVAATTDILRQALVEASGGDISHIENVDAELYAAAGNEMPDIAGGQVGSTSTVPVDSNTVQPAVTAQSLLSQVVQQPITPAPPLGSKTNPIRIIQQGNTYTSTQKLSAEQIQQIVKVLQRQNIAAKCVDGESTAVYNPETNTRIVYRVVQPHARANSNSSSGGLTARDYHQAKYGRGKGRPR